MRAGIVSRVLQDVKVREDTYALRWNERASIMRGKEK